jgi:DNA-binding response OmpR family regulator
MQVRYPGCAIELTSYEFTIFRVLAQRAGRAQIMELAKGNSEDAFDRSIDVRISLFARSSANSPAALEHQDRARRRLRARLRGL